MILLLAGTYEARRIAAGLAAANITAQASFAGATREAARLALPTRSGGFGGDAGFRRFLQSENIRAVIDATHPFAAKITARTARICTEENLPCLHVIRPAWVAGPGDNWRDISCAEDAAAYIPAGSTVFLATGRQTLPGFKNLAGRQLIMRQIDPPDAPFPWAGGEFLIGRPPFSVADEQALFQARRVDFLVVKNAGGDASRTKLDAARHLKIPVLMIHRPGRPDGTIVETADAALAWAKNR